MASKIRLLDELTVNKIAAGEVIENPSSVVKELVENSLDALATEITIEIQGGGRSLIRITDNGSGMGHDDALLSLERHATSKLKEIDDLTHLLTMGFRGEAIPSIAAISKYSCLTSDGAESTLVKVLGGKVLGCDKAEREKGTTIEIKDLFFNVPVRKKFQRSPSFDEQEITKIVSLQAITRPDVKFHLILNQKTVLSLPIQNQSERVKEVLGYEFYEDLIPLNKEGLFGFIGEPHAHKANRLHQYLFINKRPVYSSFISTAFKEAFSTHIPSNRFPAFVVFLNCDPGEIDVNVHPQKREIRLRQESDLKRLIYLAVQESLAKRNTPERLEYIFQPKPTATLPWETYTPVYVAPKQEENSLPIPSKPHFNLLTTLKGFLLVEGSDGIALIDQTRAHARILFERLEKQDPYKTEKISLLIPLLIEFSSLETEKVKKRLAHLNSLGIEMREFAPRTFAIDSYATFYKQEELEDLVKQVIDEEEDVNLNLKLAEKATLKAIGPDRLISKDEAEKLLKDLFTCKSPFESPNGKPTWVHLNHENLSKLIK
jgi:DNA mismatch repair protein MutL